MPRGQSGVDLGSAIVVGGSLVGLSLAIALARRGVAVTVLEQTVGAERGGTGLGVDRAILARVTGIDPRTDAAGSPMPVIRTHRETSTWFAIRGWLRSAAALTPGIEVRENERVLSLREEGAQAIAVTPNGDFTSDVVIGADGYRSVVRTVVDPVHPHARYGGFVLWRGLAQEAWLPEAAWNARALGGGRLAVPEAARLVAYRVPGPNGETAVGERQITFAWYDATRTAWLRAHGFLAGEEVLSSVTLDDAMRAQLRAIALEHWSGTVAAAAIVAALDHDVAFGTPLTEYDPQRLAQGRLAIAGDAAHVVSPMVGAGLEAGLLDDLTLAECIAETGGVRGEAGPRALQRYQRLRLAVNREHVQESMAATRDLLRTSHV
ncbi:MAG: FAD-dependent monooxygenase [Vulcanimicrobiaceae bacterium]|jgi:2-polyprenyl-6-methoxyphenol hydroxylase-like FAD-dependent oxidoreductase